MHLNATQFTRNSPFIDFRSTVASLHSGKNCSISLYMYMRLLNFYKIVFI